MDDFTTFGVTFEEAIKNLEKVLKSCIEANLSLSNEKCFMMLNKGIVLGHYICFQGIKADPSKIQIIVNFPIPKTQKEVRSFLRHAGYYHRFIKDFTKIVAPLFKLLVKDVNFIWDDSC